MHKASWHNLNVIPDPAYIYMAYLEFAAATENIDWQEQLDNAQTQIVENLLCYKY